jgi:hypothetical protein
MENYYMFKPVFSYTDRIVGNLTFIAESKAIIKSSPLIPEWEVSLRKDVIIGVLIHPQPLKATL